MEEEKKGTVETATVDPNMYNENWLRGQMKNLTYQEAVMQMLQLMYYLTDKRQWDAFDEWSEKKVNVDFVRMHLERERWM